MKTKKNTKKTNFDLSFEKERMQGTLAISLSLDSSLLKNQDFVRSLEEQLESLLRNSVQGLAFEFFYYSSPKNAPRSYKVKKVVK